MRRLLDDWSAAGRWWLGEPERQYFLVELSNRWVVEIYQENQEGNEVEEAHRWVLAAIQD